MTGLAIGLVVCRSGFCRGGNVEMGPTPALAPQRIAGVTVGIVLDQHEPSQELLFVAHRSRRHRLS